MLSTCPISTRKAVMRVPLLDYFTLLRVYLKPQRGRFALMAILLLVGIGLQILIPQITRVVIDTATASADDPTDDVSGVLALMALAFIGLAIFQQIISVSAAYFGERVAWTATNHLRTDLVDHCLRLDMAFHHRHPPGMLIERLDGDVSQLADFFSEFFVRILGSLLLTVGIISVLFLEDARIGVVFLIYTLVAFYVLYRVRGIAVEPFKDWRAANADLSSYMEDRLSGIEDLKANGATGSVITGLFQQQGVILRRGRRTINYLTALNLSSGMIVTVGFVVAFASGYLLYTSVAITVGTVYLIMNYMILLNRPLNELAQQIDSLQNMSASVERVQELMNTTSALIQPDDPLSLPSGALAVAFDRVSFEYETDVPVLRDVSFTLKSGETLGIVGRTGSGKTTIARLLFRLYAPQSGQITLNGVDTGQLDAATLRTRMALVTQDVQLFEGTVRDNLTFFDSRFDDADIRTALDLLELGEWLRSLPDGLDTPIQGGRGLSAGEGQLLAFARAMLRQPDLVILDEASSRLDPATERRIERAVTHLLDGRTAIIIAHRLSTLKRVDRILILENGRVVEEGERRLLMADTESRYSRLLQVGEEVLA